MASGKTWTNICPECGRHVEILNGNFEFSMELHKQSHKSLDYVNKAIDRNLNHSTEKIDNATKLNLNYCHDCNESFEIINNDVSFSFRLHAQRHKSDNADALSDHSSASSSKSKDSQKTAKEKKQTQLVVTNTLDAIFHTMPIGLKAHRGFISEKGCSKAICNLCETTVDPIFSVGEHLRTKLHEDNTITVIKSMLSSELHDQMEFISFYGSNLCCNLCRCKIDLCSENLHKTAVNIFTHNAGKGHLSKKTVSKDRNHSDKTLVILKSFALMNPLVNENQHLIEHNMYPQFKCKPCDKQIAYSENQNEMVNNFTAHFNSAGHVKYVSAVSLLTKWSTLNITGKENHNFVVAKQNIYCLSCNSDVVTNLDQLLAHVRRNSSLYGAVQSELAPGMQSMNLPNVQTAKSLSSKEGTMRSKPEDCMNQPSLGQPSQTQDSSAKFRRLVQSLPIQFRNIIIQNKKGEAVCSVCKCVIPATTYNLTTHLNGSSHNKNQNEIKSSEKIINFPQTPKTFGALAKETPANFAMEFDLLASPQYHKLLGDNKGYFARYGENKYICVLCGTIMQADVNPFTHQNILSHIESQDHKYKVQLKEEMSQLLPRHRDALVRELFDFIPMSFQKDIKFIKAPEGVNFVFCEICYIKIPRHRNCLLEHLEGGYHETSVERLGHIQPKKNVFGVKPDQSDDQLFQELLRSNKEIKMDSKYLSKTNDDYFCKLCKATIKNSYDITLLEGNIISHISGKKHKKNKEDEFSKMLDKIQLSSAVVKNNRRFLKKRNDNVLCTLCPCQMSLADSVDALRHNLEVHLSGFSHKQKLESEANTSAAPSPDAAPSTHHRDMAYLAHKTLFHDILGHDEDEYIPFRF